MATFNIHAGHAPYGSGGAYGAVGILNESVENRKVKDLLIQKLKDRGHTVYDTTCDKGLNQSGVLKEIVRNCNAHPVDLDISLHLDSGRNDYVGNGSTGGCTVYGYDNSTCSIGTSIVTSIRDALGINSRGYKTTHSLYVLNNTKSSAILIECAFVDDKDDAQAWDVEKCAEAIANGIRLHYPDIVKAVEILNTQKMYNIANDDYPHYRVHQSKIGWNYVAPVGKTSGCAPYQVEALKIDFPHKDIKVKAHIQKQGWKDYGKITGKTVIGTVGKKLRLEGLRIEAKGLKCKVFLSEGWTDWVPCDGSLIGTEGQSKAIYAIKFAYE